MVQLPLRIFAETTDFPFHIQYGTHREDDCYLHGHEDFSELVIVLDGTAQHLVGTDQNVISKGDVFVVNQYTTHGYRSANHFRICNIMFRPDAFFGQIYNIRQTIGFQALFVVEPHYTQTERFASRLRLGVNDFCTVDAMIESLMREYKEKKDGWQTAVYTLFLQVCVFLSRQYAVHPTEGNADVLKLATVIAFLEQEYCNHITLATLAERSGYSERQFSRLFQATFHTTPNRYLVHLRMNKAKQLLQNRGMTIGEIAWQCGYDDQNYFTRQFKQRFGMTPTAYQLSRSDNAEAGG